jgi:hypothetical protein
VVYQKYEPPKVRWRYPGEIWQEIIGDDYTVNQPKGKCPVLYHVFGQYVSLNTATCGQIGYWRTAQAVIGSQVLNYTPQVKSDNEWVIPLTTGEFRSIRPINSATYFAKNLVNSAGQIFNRFGSCINVSSPEHGRRLDLVEIDIIRVDRQPDDCGDCTFTITKKGQIVHQETRAVCPKVEKIPCKLSDVRHSIEIKKLPYLEKVEVVPYQYSAYKLPGVPAPIVQADQIPAECLNIYNNAIYVIPPSGQAIYPNATPFDSFVAQICSYPGCPPPEYQVICDCNNCQSCPDGTCPIECDDHICCYNDYGVSVQSIPASDYCDALANPLGGGNS